MKLLSSLLLTALAPLALASRPADTLSYTPREGLVLQRVLTLETDLELEDSTLEVDGNDLSEMAGGFEIALEVNQQIEVTDSYGRVTDGHPTALRRTFDTISSSTHVSTSDPINGSTENTAPLVSELEGATVLFTRGDDGQYEAAYAGEGSGNPDLLAGLSAEIDMADMLPGREVAPEESWTLPRSFLRQVLLPAGNLSLHAEEGPASEFDISPADIIDGIAGEATATYAGTRTEDGVQVAVIRLAVKAHGARDMTEKSGAMLDKMHENMPPGTEAELEAFDVEMEYDLEGELHWDLENGLPHSLEMGGEVSQFLDISLSVRNADGHQSIVRTMMMGGSIKLGMTVSQ
jgi:hypothetical protein